MSSPIIHQHIPHIILINDKQDHDLPIQSIQIEFVLKFADSSTMSCEKWNETGDLDGSRLSKYYIKIIDFEKCL